MKEKVKHIKEGKAKLELFSKDIKQEIALSRALNQDIKQYNLVSSDDSKNTYAQRIGKKLSNILDKCPNVSNDYPKMIKEAQGIVRESTKQKSLSNNIEKG